MRGALWLMIALTMTCTVLGVSALYAYQLHVASYATDRLRVRTIAETYAAQVAVILADTALYHAKKAGKCCAKIYSPNQIVPNGALRHMAVQS